MDSSDSNVDFIPTNLTVDSRERVTRRKGGWETDRQREATRDRDRGFEGGGGNRVRTDERDLTVKPCTLGGLPMWPRAQDPGLGGTACEDAIQRRQGAAVDASSTSTSGSDSDDGLGPKGTRADWMA